MRLRTVGDAAVKSRAALPKVEFCHFTKEPLIKPRPRGSCAKQSRGSTGVKLRHHGFVLQCGARGGGALDGSGCGVRLGCPGGHF
eukprot:7101963-Pyramimonas_sp.AAC.1